jgi:chromosome segregation ATPase
MNSVADLEKEIAEIDHEREALEGKKKAAQREALAVELVELRKILPTLREKNAADGKQLQQDIKALEEEIKNNPQVRLAQLRREQSNRTSWGNRSKELMKTEDRIKQLEALLAPAEQQPAPAMEALRR